MQKTQAVHNNILWKPEKRISKKKSQFWTRHELIPPIESRMCMELREETLLTAASDESVCSLSKRTCKETVYWKQTKNNLYLKRTCIQQKYQYELEFPFFLSLFYFQQY